MRAFLSRLKARSKAMWRQYGLVFFGTITGLWILELALWMTFLKAGISFDWMGDAGSAGAPVVALAVTQLTKPTRVVVSIAITPFVARLLRIAGRPEAA